MLHIYFFILSLCKRCFITHAVKYCVLQLNCLNYLANQMKIINSPQIKCPITIRKKPLKFLIIFCLDKEVFCLQSWKYLDFLGGRGFPKASLKRNHFNCFSKESINTGCIEGNELLSESIIKMPRTEYKENLNHIMIVPIGWSKSLRIAGIISFRQSLSWESISCPGSYQILREYLAQWQIETTSMHEIFP